MWFGLSAQWTLTIFIHLFGRFHLGRASYVVIHTVWLFASVVPIFIDEPLSLKLRTPHGERPKAERSALRSRYDLPAGPISVCRPSKILSS